MNLDVPRMVEHRTNTTLRKCAICPSTSHAWEWELWGQKSVTYLSTHRNIYEDVLLDANFLSSFSSPAASDSFTCLLSSTSPVTRNAGSLITWTRAKLGNPVLEGPAEPSQLQSHCDDRPLLSPGLRQKAATVSKNAWTQTRKRPLKTGGLPAGSVQGKGHPISGMGREVISVLIPGLSLLRHRS